MGTNQSKIDTNRRDTCVTLPNEVTGCILTISMSEQNIMFAIHNIWRYLFLNTLVDLLDSITLAIDVYIENVKNIIRVNNIL